ncbi:MAG: hypothetical protein ACRD0Z_04410 [Acidimicrobiales bacterium]
MTWPLSVKRSAPTRARTGAGWLPALTVPVPSLSPAAPGGGGTLIALAIDGEVVAGVATSPGMRRRWWGLPGMGAWTTVSAGQW